jgi:ribosomal-protein-alanine N-acetyltransferase
MNILHQDQSFIIRQFSVEEQNLFCDLFEDAEVTKYLP